MNLNSKKKQEAIKSYLRIKPIITNQQRFLQCKDQHTVVIKGQQEYSFNKIFTDKSTNSDLFSDIGDPLIRHSLQGYNACVLAYGQTSSGKTFTMKGFSNSQGLIPLTIGELFRKIKQQNMTAEIKISYFQIYNENIIDLLGNPDNYLEIREDYKKNISIVGLNEVKVQSVEQSMKYFQEGQTKRKFSSNTLNLNSSRSHTIFRISLDIIFEDFSRSQSYINMVDLAGSEGVSRTKAEGSTRKQGDNINKSILALSNVIRHMSQKQSYVNFRDSKLTRILQSSLCSNSRSVVICTVYPVISNLQETINTLKFGVEASNIKLSVKQNYNRSNCSNTNTVNDLQFNEQNGLLANQRIEYQENKRIVSHLREQNKELRIEKRKLDQKIEFLDLQIHRQDGIIKNYQDQLERHRKLVFKKDISVEERQIFQSTIEDLKVQMNIMADKYDLLSQQNSKLQKNERYLLDRIAKYESQLQQLKETAEIPRKPMTPKKPKIVKMIEKQQEYCPLTIGSIVVLKAQIIKLRQQLCSCHQDFARLIEQRNQLNDKLENIEKQNYEQVQFKSAGKMNPSHHESKQIKSLLMKIKKLKKQISFGRNREKKLIKLLKSQAQKNIEEYQEFNQWMVQKRQVLSTNKQDFI